MGRAVPGQGRILICDEKIPTHDRDAGSLRMTWIIRLLLTLGWEVAVFPLDRQRRDPYAADLERIGVEVFSGAPSLQDIVAIRPEGYDVVILSRHSVARFLMASVRRALPRARVVYDTVDLGFLRERRELSVAGSMSMLDRLRIYRRKLREFHLVRCSDLTVAVTETEAIVIRRHVPTANVVVIPIIHAAEPYPRGRKGRAGLLFIGGKHRPNADAMVYFIREILPLVSHRLEAKLCIVGPEPSEDILSLQSSQVIVKGYVRDPAPVFRQSRVFVSPLRYGAGMKGKNGQAMAYGLPMVTTSIGAEGMDVVDGRHALIRDDPISFADAVVELYKSEELWDSISRNSWAHAQQRWSPEAVRPQLRHLLATVGQTRIKQSLGQTLDMASPAASTLSPLDARRPRK